MDISRLILLLMTFIVSSRCDITRKEKRSVIPPGIKGLDVEPYDIFLFGNLEYQFFSQLIYRFAKSVQTQVVKYAQINNRDPYRAINSIEDVRREDLVDDDGKVLFYMDFDQLSAKDYLQTLEDAVKAAEQIPELWRKQQILGCARRILADRRADLARYDESHPRYKAHKTIITGWVEGESRLEKHVESQKQGGASTVEPKNNPFCHLDQTYKAGKNRPPSKSKNKQKSKK